MSKDTGIGCIGTIAIIALIVIGFVFFREKLVAISAVVVIVAAPFLPLYYVYKKNQEEQRLTVEYERGKVLRESIESLKEVEELVEGSIEEFKGFGSYIKDWDNRGIEEIEEFDRIEIEVANVLEQDSWEDAKEYLELYRDELKGKRDELKWELKELRGETSLASEYGAEIRQLYAVKKKIWSVSSNLNGISYIY